LVHRETKITDEIEPDVCCPQLYGHLPHLWFHLVACDFFCFEGIAMITVGFVIVKQKLIKG